MNSSTPCFIQRQILTKYQEEGYEVIAFMADVGQEEDFAAAKEKALKIGATKCYIEDLRREVRSINRKDFG